MGKKRPAQDKIDHRNDKGQRPSLFGALFSRRERDEEYLPELKAQWGEMDQKTRVKFVAGMIAGLVLFFGALILVYLILAAIAG